MYRRTLPEFFPQLAGRALPGAERIARTLLTLPTNHHVQAHDLARIVALVREVIRSQ
jgi:dTDP-4-amino-4,6-dideoxygalactose transaminase